MTSFARWAGENGEIEQYEFQEALTAMETYKRWDVDGDGMLQADEFSRSVFRLWDIDDSGHVDDGEWSTVHRAWYQPDQSHGMFDDWDESGDGYLSRSETARGIRRTNLFNYWDHDDSSALGEEEFADHVFSVWDGNGDEGIDENEWNEHLDTWRDQKLMASLVL